MSNRSLGLKTPPAFPATPLDWANARDVKVVRTLNDFVEDIHKVLLDSEHSQRYTALLYAVYDAQAVEGSLACDNTLAAQIIRDYAQDEEHQIPEVAREKLAIISKSLGVVLRRYHQSRKERRDMIAGEVVPGDSNCGE